MRNGTYTRVVASLALCAALGACASDAGGEAVGRLLGGHAQGDADQVTVHGLTGLDALPVAVAHCARHGKDARFVRRAGDGALYACRPRGT